MSMLPEQLRGTGVALVTPFTPDGKVDETALTRLVQHVIKGKCEYVVALGTTGETVTLNADERALVVSTVIAASKGKVPVVLGHGGNDTAELIRSLKETDLTGISAILSASPAYNKPSQAGIIAHYKAFCKASPLPVILYNVPGRTGSNLLPDTTRAIANLCKNVIGIKEASGNLDQIMDVVSGALKDFTVISGDDNLTLAEIGIGVQGVISVVANAYPRETSDMVRLALKNDFTKARTLHYSLLPLIPKLFAEGNPAGIKAVLKELGICGDTVRLPLVPVSKPLAMAIKATMKSMS